MVQRNATTTSDRTCVCNTNACSNAVTLSYQQILCRTPTTDELTIEVSNCCGGTTDATLRDQLSKSNEGAGESVVMCCVVVVCCCLLLLLVVVIVVIVVVVCCLLLLFVVVGCCYHSPPARSPFLHPIYSIHPRRPPQLPRLHTALQLPCWLLRVPQQHQLHLRAVQWRHRVRALCRCHAVHARHAVQHGQPARQPAHPLVQRCGACVCVCVCVISFICLYTSESVLKILLKYLESPHTFITFFLNSHHPPTVPAVPRRHQ